MKIKKKTKKKNMQDINFINKNLEEIWQNINDGWILKMYGYEWPKTISSVYFCFEDISLLS
jgi:hypothetical protein